MESPPQPTSTSLRRRLVKLDTAVSLRLYTLTQPILPRPLLRLLEISGDGRLFFPITISLFLSPLSSRTTAAFLRPFLTNLLLGGILDLLIIGLIKHLVRRPRPVYNKGMFLTFAVDHWSFPSGHSSRVCFVAAFITLSSALLEEALAQFRSSGTEFDYKWINLKSFDEIGVANVNYIVAIVCLWAATTSISRVLLGRHFVFDVVAGACLGVIEALIVFHFFNYSVLSSNLGWQLCGLRISRILWL